MRRLTAILLVAGTLFMPRVMAQDVATTTAPDTTTPLYTDAEISELLHNMPNVEVGKGISFTSKDNKYKLNMRLRMQSMVGLTFDNSMGLTETEACVKRLHLRFDGYVFTPKVGYSIQLGYTPYDAKDVPNGNLNILRDAMIYYTPSSMWNFGFGQTKLRGSRANINSSSALQFVDRSIVNSQFHIDRDFGIFGEFHNKIGKQFHYAIKASITSGEGRNFVTSQNSGLAYTARVELYPLGSFTSRGEVSEGCYVQEATPKLALGGAFSYNDRACRVSGQRGALLDDGNRRSLQSWFADLIFKYDRFAFYTDVMGRICHNPNIYDANKQISQQIYTGWGINVQASYLFPKNWEIAARHSSLLPDKITADYEGYKSKNQATVALTKYFIGHNLKVHLDISYNYATDAAPHFLGDEHWQARLSVDVGI